MKHPIVRGLIGALALVVVAYISYLGTGSEPGLFLAATQPHTLEDWILIGGIMSGAFIAGLLNGLMKAPIIWLILGIALFPAHLCGLWFVTGFGNAAWSQTAFANTGFVVFLTLAFVAPTIVFRRYRPRNQSVRNSE